MFTAWLFIEFEKILFDSPEIKVKLGLVTLGSFLRKHSQCRCMGVQFEKSKHFLNDG